MLEKLNNDPEVPPVTAIIADSCMSFAIEAGRVFGVPVVSLWTASACGLMAYFQFPEFVKRGIFPFKGSFIRPPFLFKCRLIIRIIEQTLNSILLLIHYHVCLCDDVICT